MLRPFKLYIAQQKLFSRKDKILLAVSGGIDSIVMCELFYQAKLNFGIAHCNFCLRGDESEGDELFVKELAAKYNVPFHYVKFNTNETAHQEGISIQMAARQLRYDWFEALLKEHQYLYIATAHHQNDQTETFFINLLRGTGIAGLHGILPKQHNIIRPLLFAGRDEIVNYATANKLTYREDSSNASNKYQRNLLRNQIMPLFREMKPDFDSTMSENIVRIAEAEIIFNEMIDQKRKMAVKEENDVTLISIAVLKEFNAVGTYLHHFLLPFNFNSDIIPDIVKSLDDIPGKLFYSPTHRLVRDREYLIISKITEAETDCPLVYIKENTAQICLPLVMNFNTISDARVFKIIADNKVAYLDYDQLKFPLIIRKWTVGDHFYPFGMENKKKLSDFFINQKLSLNQKENTWLLCSGNDIVWIIGIRIDNRFRITTKTKTIYKIELS